MKCTPPIKNYSGAIWHVIIIQCLVMVTIHNPTPRNDLRHLFQALKVQYVGWVICISYAFIPVLIHQRTCIWSGWWDSRGTECICLSSPVFSATKPVFNSLGKLSAGNSYPICQCHWGSLSVSWHRAHADNVDIKTWKIWLSSSRLEKI